MKTQKTPIFQGIGETALAEMFTCGGARCKTYAKGEVLLRAGCITCEVGIVQAGGVNIENIDLWGILCRALPHGTGRARRGFRI